MTKNRVLVCGGRDFSDWGWLCSVLDQIDDARNIFCIIEGGAGGADMFAYRWAKANDKPLVRVPANWTQHGNMAGPLRNSAMIRDWDPTLVVAFPGGSGTDDMVGKAIKAGIETYVFHDKLSEVGHYNEQE